MASGPYHYRQAEGGIEYALSSDEEHSHEDVMRILAVAQVHATLAHAAATAQSAPADEMPAEDIRAWMSACSEKQSEAVSQ